MFVDRALAYAVKEDHSFLAIQKTIRSSLRRNREEALAELSKIYEDEQMQPIAYNHYFTDNVKRLDKRA